MFCRLEKPLECACDVFPTDRPKSIPDSHRHFLHALLEALYQQGIESVDPVIERFVEESILGPAHAKPGAHRQAWWENPSLLAHLEQNPTFHGLLRSPRGCNAVYDWAGVRVPEIIAYEMHIIGWRDDVIALHMHEKEPTVRQLYANAEARIKTAMAMVDFPKAS